MSGIVDTLSSGSSDLFTDVGGFIAEIFNIIAGIFGGEGDTDA